MSGTEISGSDDETLPMIGSKEMSGSECCMAISGSDGGMGVSDCTESNGSDGDAENEMSGSDEAVRGATAILTTAQPRVIASSCGYSSCATTSYATVPVFGADGFPIDPNKFANSETSLPAPGKPRDSDHGQIVGNYCSTRMTENTHYVHVFLSRLGRQSISTNQQVPTHQKNQS